MKTLLKKAGAEGKSTVFLLSDSQVKEESFLEDTSMILNTGDISNLYAADEKVEILERMQGAAREAVSLVHIGTNNLNLGMYNETVDFHVGIFISAATYVKPD